MTQLFSILCSLILAFQTPVIGTNRRKIFPVAATHTFTFVETQNSNGNCGGGASNTCAVTVTSTTAGALLVIYAGGINPTLAPAITSCSGGANTYVIAPNTNQWESHQESVYNGVYVLSSVSGVTSITCTFNASPVGLRMIYSEYTYTGGGSAVFDSSNVLTRTGQNPVIGITPSIGGSSDACVQFISTDNNAISSVSTYGHFTSGTTAMADLLNTTSTTAPQWTGAGNNDASLSYMCFK